MFSSSPPRWLLWRHRRACAGVERLAESSETLRIRRRRRLQGNRRVPERQCRIGRLFVESNFVTHRRTSPTLDDRLDETPVDSAIRARITRCLTAGAQRRRKFLECETAGNGHARSECEYLTRAERGNECQQIGGGVRH